MTACDILRLVSLMNLPLPHEVNVGQAITSYLMM